MARPGITQAMVLSKPQRSSGQEYLRLALYDEELNHINLIEALAGASGGGGAPAASRPPIVTQLPVSPAVDDEIYLKIDAFRYWHLIHVTGGEWNFLGGGSLLAEGYQQEMTVAGAWTTLEEDPPVINLPYPGTYDVNFGATTQHETPGADIWITPVATGLTPGDGYWAMHRQPDTTGNELVSLSRHIQFGQMLGQLSVKYHQSIAGGFISNIFIRATPVRIRRIAE